MINIPKTDLKWDGPKGSWFPVKRENGERSAMFICPNCGQAAGLSHEIKSDGIVHPSVVCPYEGCNFHDFIKLEGWE